MKYLAILRGINVSGQKKIKMVDLKILFESFDLQNIETYIQTGNVIFESTSIEIPELQHKIESAITQRFGFEVPVQIRTQEEIKTIVDRCPFNLVDPEIDGTRVLVTFLNAIPSSKDATIVQEYVLPPEQLILIEREVYLHCPNGYGRSKLSNTFLEKKFGVLATTRNWKSVTKLNELLNG